MRASNRKPRCGAGRWLADFVVALALFWFAAFAFGGAHNRAHAIQLPTLRSPAAHPSTALSLHAWGQAARTDIRATRETGAAHTRTLVLLSVVFAGLAALNLAFWRHLRRVYASPRRGVWRRG